MGDQDCSVARQSLNLNSQDRGGSLNSMRECCCRAVGPFSTCHRSYSSSKKREYLETGSTKTKQNKQKKTKTKNTKSPKTNKQKKPREVATVNRCVYTCGWYEPYPQIQFCGKHHICLFKSSHIGFGHGWRFLPHPTSQGQCTGRALRSPLGPGAQTQAFVVPSCGHWHLC